MSDTRPVPPVDAIVQLSFEVQARLTKVAAGHGLSLTQLRLLGVVRDRDLAILQLADHLGLEKSSVSGLVDRAEARGLVQRRPSATDGRGVQVALSDRGRSLATVVEAEVQAALDDLVGPLTPTDADRLARLASRCLGS